MFTVLEKVGLVCITIVGFQILRIIIQMLYIAVIGPQIGKINVNRLKDMGKWALITGATDGLGKAYADALAEKGMNVILVSRNLEKLNKVSTEIESSYKVETKIIQADFTQGDEIFHHIEKQCLGLEIGVLVNNVGISYPHPEYFLTLPDGNKVYNNIIRCNIVSVSNMCQIFMPQMVERKRGVVINISSAAAQFPSPLLAVYAATKAYVEKFSDDIATEYNKSGIIVQCVLPGYVATNMSKIRSSTWMAPTPKKYVQHALKTIGVEKKTNGYFPHTLLVGTLSILESISPKLPRWITMRTMENIRARALRRYVS